MGLRSSCMQQSVHESKIQIVNVQLPKRPLKKEPNRQNVLTPPILPLVREDTFEIQQFEQMLNSSLHRTASFGASFQTSLKGSQSQSNTNKKSLISMIDQAIIEERSSQNNSPVQQKKQLVELETSSFKQMKLQQNQETVKDYRPIKTSQFNNKQEKSRDNLSKSLSINDRNKQNDDSNISELSQISQRKDSETNTVKSILKNKGKQLEYQKNFNRGQSLRILNKKANNDDTTSQKTVKSLSKKVSFDPKIFRPKNRNGFM